MNLLRTLVVSACVALAACAAPASQEPSQQAAPAAASTAPRAVDRSCKVDADCDAKPRCVGTECRCVQDTCIAKREALDPVIDPAPASSVR